MEIKFETKQQSKQRQLQEFLSLSPYERFQKFLRLSRKMKNTFSTPNQFQKKDNFYITKKNN